MGSKSSKSPKKIYIEAIRVQTLCIQVKVFLQGYRRDIQTQIENKEREFLKQITSQNTIPRHEQCEIQQLSKIIELMIFNVALDVVIRKAEVLKDQATRIEQSKGLIADVNDLVPFIQNICWANLAFKVSCLEQFQNEFLVYFGEPLAVSLQSFENLDNRIKMALAPAIVASFEDLNGYTNSFCRKYSISIEEFNGNIHRFTLENIRMQSGYGSSNFSITPPTSERFQKQQQQLEKQEFVPSNHYENAYLLASRIGQPPTKCKNVTANEGEEEPRSKFGICC